MRRRARQINRVRVWGGESVLLVRTFCQNSSFFSSPPPSGFTHKILHMEIRPLRFPSKIFFNFPEEGSPLPGSTKSSPFPHTCPNFQLFLGNSNVFFNIFGNSASFSNTCVKYQLSMYQEIRKSGSPVLQDQKVLPEVRNRSLLLRDFVSHSTFRNTF